MKTPVADFVRVYETSGTARFHMPGHKGRGALGCESLDITEIAGADSLYEAGGIIAESEQNAAALFGSARTLYSAEGSSQCIRAMIFLAVTYRRPEASPVILAARNAHKAFLYALAAVGADVVWLWGEERASLCSCSITPAELEKALSRQKAPPAAVYLTSPDYLGQEADISALAAVCRRFQVPLLVDNAHGAYRHFLPPPQDPLTLGASVCCASAHKTLPVLTGGAYLHLAGGLPKEFYENARSAMELFGSTSPSYLILQSLDLCNRLLAEGYGEKLAETAKEMDALKRELRILGWQVPESDPLRLVLRGNGKKTAERLRSGGIEPEYADRDFAVLMATPENSREDLERIVRVLGKASSSDPAPLPALLSAPKAVCSPREALFSKQERLPPELAEGRVCAHPTVSCPPAVPIVMAGERIGRQEIELFRYYGIREVCVMK